MYKKRFAVAGLGLALGVGFVMSAGLTTSACSSGSSSAGPPVRPDSGGGGDGTVSDAGTDVVIGSDGGQALKPFTYPADPGPGAFYVTISGESNALTGYPFPPDNFSADSYMPDGWEFQIFEYIVVVDKITLWSNPDQSTTDQSQHGPAVAHLDGPFVVDLHKGGKIVGQGGYPELATPIGVIMNQNDNGGAAFDTTGGTRYGFGFSTVQATYDAYNVNLDDSEAADFATMVQKGYSVFYRGAVVWKGDDPGNPYAPCTQTNAGAGEDAGLVQEGDAEVPTYVDGGYDFMKLPQTFTFRLGFNTPTNYVNCQNFTAQGMGIGNEPNPRGVQVSTSQYVVAQATVHMDHPFWESFVENTPVHLDQIAAQYVGSTGVPEAHTEDMKGVSPAGFTDKSGTPLPWHNCSGDNYSPLGDGQMFFYTRGIPVNPAGTCVPGNCNVIRDYYDFLRYNQSTQGHLNSQGACYVDRQYPSPVGNSF